MSDEICEAAKIAARKWFKDPSCEKHMKADIAELEQIIDEAIDDGLESSYDEGAAKGLRLAAALVRSRGYPETAKDLEALAKKRETDAARPRENMDL